MQFVNTVYVSDHFSWSKTLTLFLRREESEGEEYLHNGALGAHWRHFILWQYPWGILQLFLTVYRGVQCTFEYGNIVRVDCLLYREPLSLASYSLSVLLTRQSNQWMEWLSVEPIILPPPTPYEWQLIYIILLFISQRSSFHISYASGFQSRGRDPHKRLLQQVYITQV